MQIIKFIEIITKENKNCCLNIRNLVFTIGKLNFSII